MRAKQLILEEIHRKANKTTDWDTTASLHERITIEVLIDIRDILGRLAKAITIVQASTPHPD